MDEIKELNKATLKMRVRERIASYGEPIEKIALSLNVSERVIYMWMSGSRTPNLDCVYKMSQLFKVSMESILA